jgi:hypothetical protein
MEYQKRLRFIDYIKKSFTLKKEEMLMFHFVNYDQLNLIKAQKLKNSIDYPMYNKLRKKLNLGTCTLDFTFDRGLYLEFSDDFLNYEEWITLGRCVNNSLNIAMERCKQEIKADIEGLFLQLNGEEPTYRKSDC